MRLLAPVKVPLFLTTTPPTTVTPMIVILQVDGLCLLTKRLNAKELIFAKFTLVI
jgi:hypothetical protein